MLLLLLLPLLLLLLLLHMHAAALLLPPFFIPLGSMVCQRSSQVTLHRRREPPQPQPKRAP